MACAQTELRDAWSDRQHVDLIADVVARVLRGAGVTIGDVGFVIDCGSDILDGRSISNCGFLGAMGAHHKEESRVEEDGLWGALYAASKIAAGAADIGLVIAYSKPSEASLRAFYASQGEPFYQRPTGFDDLAASGIQAQRYLADWELEESVLAHVVVSDWQRAAANPAVQVDAAPTLEDVAASPHVARPLHEFEISRPVDGAVAVLLATRQVANRVTPTPVWITGMGAAIDEHAFASRDRDLPACRAAAQMAYKRAGIDEPGSCSIVETGAGSAAGELLVLDALRVGEPGRSHELHDSSNGPAVNPSGGSLPADPVMATGLVRLSEAALQLAGRVDHAPAGASSAIVHGTGGLGMQNHCVFTLEV